jgi:DNA-directed RNA polymerase sigma subunit (sigma70/sigma32)
MLSYTLGFVMQIALAKKYGVCVMSSDDDLKKDIKRTLEQITPSERAVLKQRFGIDIAADMSLNEVVRQFDITREKIGEIERRATQA